MVRSNHTQPYIKIQCTHPATHGLTSFTPSLLTQVKGSCKEGTILKIIEFIIESNSIWENGGKGDKKFTQK